MESDFEKKLEDVHKYNAWLTKLMSFLMVPLPLFQQWRDFKKANFVLIKTIERGTVQGKIQWGEGVVRISGSHIKNNTNKRWN